MGGKSPIVRTYPNGFRLVYERPSKDLATSHLQVFCHVGSIHEPEDLRGAAHFIEHMCFKGSSRHPSYKSINIPFSKTASYFNAETTKQYTHYKVICTEEHIAEFLEILGDALLRSKFDRAEYDLEWNVVREEVIMKTPNSYIENLAFEGTAYGEWVDHKSYHKKGSLPYEKVVEFYKQYYVPQNMVLSVASRVAFETICRYLGKTIFTQNPPGPKITPPILNPMPPCRATRGPDDTNYAFHSTSGAVSRVEIGFDICDQFNMEEYYTLNLLRHIIGSSMSSRLFVELREKLGLTYRSGAEMVLYEIGGIFVIYAVTDTHRLIRDEKSDGVLPVLFDMVRHLIEHGVGESEIKWAKERMRETFNMEQVIGQEKCAYNGKRIMLHNESDIATTDSMYSKFYHHLDKKQVDAIIRKYFSMDRVYLSIFGGKLPAKSAMMKFLSRR